MATFGEFTVARLGMMASQYALNVTGHNISNINTYGYTRQRVDQYSFITNGSGLYHATNSTQVGSGVMMAGVSQLRDPFLDIRFRKEMSSVGSAGATLNGLGQLESVINTVNKEGITSAIRDLVGRLQDLSADHATEQEFDTLVRSSAEALCQLLNINAKNLQTVYDNVMTEYKQNVNKADTILSEIQKLNEQIRRADINGDPALELRDKRNTLVDELSEFMKIDVTYSDENVGAGVTVEKMTIKMVNNKENRPGKTLIDGIYRADLSIMEQKDPNTGDPILGPDGKPLLDPALRLEISELHDSAREVFVSNTASQFEVGGLNLDKNTAGGNQQVEISYTDKDGNKHTAQLNFNVVKPAVTPPATEPTSQEIAEASKQSLKNLQDEINKHPDLQKLFEAKPSGSGMMITSKEKGEEAASIGEMKFTAGNTGATLGPTKNNPAIPTNKGPVEEGEGYGALESTRQMLVGEGEFRTDGGDVSIRGIPYYQKSLDAIANKLATEMNRVNTTRPDGSSFNVAGPNGELAQTQAGNLFMAEGDDPNNPQTVITANNIRISSDWQSGKVHIVSSIDGDPLQGTENDNINRLKDILEKGHVFRPTDIVRTDKTTFTTGDAKQDMATVPAGTQLKAELTYIDSMNVQHKVTVNFAAGADADATQNNLLTALQADPKMADFDITDNGLSLTFDDKNVTPDGKLCNLVTGIKFTDANGNLTDGFSLGNGKIDGDVSGDKYYTGTLESGYANMEGVLGSHMMETNKVYETYMSSADEINTSRDGVSGVDLNEEGINLMQYQKSFAAACRVMTALDEAMDKVINGMGVVGR